MTFPAPNPQDQMVQIHEGQPHVRLRWQCDCCGSWTAVGQACPYGTTEEMYDEVGRAMLKRDEDAEHTVTLTGHQWQLIIDCLGDTSDGEDHLHGLMVAIDRQVS